MAIMAYGRVSAASLLANTISSEILSPDPYIDFIFILQEMQHLQKRSGSQVSELQALAEEQFNRANKLSDELMRIKSKKQVKLLQEILPLFQIFSLCCVSYV